MDHQNRAICGAKNVAHNKYTSMQRKILGMCLSYLHAALVGADEEADRGAPWQQVGGVPWPPPEPERSSRGRGMHRPGQDCNSIPSLDVRRRRKLSKLVDKQAVVMHNTGVAVVELSWMITE
jgi:hypothetical protein